MMKGNLVTGDFEKNEMTFKIEGEMVLQGGEYTIQRHESFSPLTASNFEAYETILKHFLEELTTNDIELLRDFQFEKVLKNCKIMLEHQ